MGTRRQVGGILGVIGSVLEAFVSLILLMTTVGLSQGQFGFGTGAQLAISYELLVVGSIVELFVGFPIGMFGSVGGVTHWEQRSDEGDQSST